MISVSSIRFGCVHILPSGGAREDFVNGLSTQEERQKAVKIDGTLNGMECCGVLDGSHADNFQRATAALDGISDQLDPRYHITIKRPLHDYLQRAVADYFLADKNVIIHSQN